ncbi:transposase, IS5 family [Neisseria meningitidis]|uniref:Transposase, IS5 family n=1 Tax=Neisseria meningitidis TaxID=487 RepID=A0AAC9GCL4_NEIME|nr:transposase, IS5 family [Neisseria meningitidis]ANW93333.1 transposase, IS5 family [Neisseria meningitidis]
MQKFYVIDFLSLKSIFLNKFALKYSGLNLNQDKATKPQTVRIVRQGEATPYWFKFNPLYRKFIQWIDREENKVV